MPSLPHYPWHHKWPPCLLCHLVQYRVCYLPPTRQTTTMAPLVDYPHRHIKHAHLQSWLWVKIIIKHYWRLETITNINWTRTISPNILQEPINIQHSHKNVLPYPIMDRSTVHKLIGSNKVAANKRILHLTTTTLTFPKMVLPKNNKL